MLVLLLSSVLQVADDVEMEYMSAAERQGGGYYPEAAAVQGSEEHNLNGKSPKSFLGYFLLSRSTSEYFWLKERFCVVSGRFGASHELVKVVIWLNTSFKNRSFE